MLHQCQKKMTQSWNDRVLINRRNLRCIRMVFSVMQRVKKNLQSDVQIRKVKEFIKKINKGLNKIISRKIYKQSQYVKRMLEFSSQMTMPSTLTRFLHYQKKDFNCNRRWHIITKKLYSWWIRNFNVMFAKLMLTILYLWIQICRNKMVMKLLPKSENFIPMFKNNPKLL